MTDLVRKLARSRGLSKKTAEVAAVLAARASALDPQGSYRVEETVLTIRGLPRTAWVVVNGATGASTREFGRGGTRALGRAAQSVRGA